MTTGSGNHKVKYKPRLKTLSHFLQWYKATREQAGTVLQPCSSSLKKIDFSFGTNDYAKMMRSGKSLATLVSCLNWPPVRPNSYRLTSVDVTKNVCLCVCNSVGNSPIIRLSKTIVQTHTYIHKHTQPQSQFHLSSFSLCALLFSMPFHYPPSHYFSPMYWSEVANFSPALLLCVCACVCVSTMLLCWHLSRGFLFLENWV